MWGAPAGRDPSNVHLEWIVWSSLRAGGSAAARSREVARERGANIADALEGPQREVVLTPRSGTFSCLTVTSHMSQLMSQYDKGKKWANYDDGDVISQGEVCKPLAAIELKPHLQYFLNRRLTEDPSAGVNNPFPELHYAMRDSVRPDYRIVTIVQEHCPWIIPLGSHVANGNLTFELTINQVDEFARRRLDWLVVNDKQPQVQLYINLKDKPDHCLLLLHTELH